MKDSGIETPVTAPIKERRLMDTHAGETLLALRLLTKEGTLIQTPAYIRAVRGKDDYVYRIRGIDDYSVQMDYYDRGTDTTTTPPKSSFLNNNTNNPFWKLDKTKFEVSTESAWRRGSIINTVITIH